MTGQYQGAVRYLGPAALSAASLVLLLATDRSLPLPGGRVAEVQPVAATASQGKRSPAPPRTVLPDSARRRSQLPKRSFTGRGFDACTAPPLETMRVWRTTSPYGAVGIYTSGTQRGCDQPRLTADWVRQVREMGWELVPTHVGLQAPCSSVRTKPHRIDPARAVEQGQDEAAEAVSGLRELGLGEGSPVYLDIEAYAPGDPVCSQAVVEFTIGWTQALHAAGYHSGFYSSANSGVADLVGAAQAGAYPLPDVIWYAHWDGRAVTDGQGALPEELWVGHQRIHQYRGGGAETYGGAALNVDRDQLDGLVALGAPPAADRRPGRS
ncbi:glycoside hydrolase domain-containing protein [Kitasatospora sp. GP82]|uniref:glycoside hydrolase domain-containing protein n=1 Tax=Kitasatospora sp. GP82 TaxID=3035089 RepID=UPI002474AA52|nr:glycoside hydrolase domain-containing protein [Kitasatospora sp. GP82]MDH6123547.1 hypothetical protein [Kitasatospora sp. GP82]